MIKKYNSISQQDYMKKYECYQETYKYIISLLDANLIQSDSKKKSLNYLQEILDNDGPEYSYTINFSPVHDTTVIYEIGVCVRGVPLLRKISGSTIAKNKWKKYGSFPKVVYLLAHCRKSRITIFKAVGLIVSIKL